MIGNVDLKADPDVSKVSDIAEIVNQKIEDNFTRGLAPKKSWHIASFLLLQSNASRRLVEAEWCNGGCSCQ